LEAAPGPEHPESASAAQIIAEKVIFISYSMRKKRYLFNRELSLLSRSKKCPVINAKEVAVENRAEETYYHRTI